MLPDLSHDALIRATQKEDLIRKTADQITKDFAELGLEVTFSGQTDQFYPELFHQVNILVEEMMANDMNRFLTMLYRIDISNKEISTYQKQMEESTQPEIVTTLIIHRELKKVMTREYFKQQNKQ